MSDIEGLPGRPLNRSERRQAMNNLRAFRRRAARARDREAGRRGRGTPPLPISTALRLAGSDYIDGDDGRALIDRLEPEQRAARIAASSRRIRQSLMRK